PNAEAQRHGYDWHLHAIRRSPVHMSLMAGWNEPMDLPAHIVWQMPRYRDFAVHDLSNADRAYKSEMRIEGMAAYLMSPTARDHSSKERYPNKSSVMILVEANEAWLDRSKTDPAFRAELEHRFREEGLRLIAQHYPQTRGKTPQVAHVQFPMCCNLRAWNGCSYGIEASADRFMAHTHWLRPKTKVEGLFMCGQDAFMPGVGGVLLGARFAYAAITGD